MKLPENKFVFRLSLLQAMVEMTFTQMLFQINDKYFCEVAHTCWHLLCKAEYKKAPIFFTNLKKIYFSSVISQGPCWKSLPGSGFIISPSLSFSGDNILYLYPDCRQESEIIRKNIFLQSFSFLTSKTWHNLTIFNFFRSCSQGVHSTVCMNSRFPFDFKVIKRRVSQVFYSIQKIRLFLYKILSFN